MFCKSSFALCTTWSHWIRIVEINCNQEDYQHMTHQWHFFPLISSYINKGSYCIYWTLLEIYLNFIINTELMCNMLAQLSFLARWGWTCLSKKRLNRNIKRILKARKDQCRGWGQKQTEQWSTGISEHVEGLYFLYAHPPPVTKDTTGH